MKKSRRKKFRVAIIGATGAVGQEMLRLVEQRSFPIQEIRCFSSARSAGKTVLFQGQSIPLEQLSQESFQNIDFALFSAGKSVSLIYAPLAAAAGCIVIDNSSAFRMDPNVPLVIPEINPEALSSHQGIISSPNCTATVMLPAVAPLHRLVRTRRIVATTSKAASGAGHQAMVE